VIFLLIFVTENVTSRLIFVIENMICRLIFVTEIVIFFCDRKCDMSPDFL
jgi:hypothetical protein